MAVTFYDLSSDAGLKKLDDYLLSRSYITGYQASKDDLTVHAALSKPPSSEYVNVSRWYNHIEALLRISGVSGEGSGVTIEGSAPVADAIATPPAADSKATVAEDEDDDDDVDLFGEETEEEKKAAEERAAAVKASGKKKESGKSSVLLDVKPWDDETDMKLLEEAIRSVEMEGLFWGASKLVPVGYGIKKLQIMMTIIDDLVSVDTLIEERLTVEPINEYVQSCDIVAFNKIFAEIGSFPVNVVGLEVPMNHHNINNNNNPMRGNYSFGNPGIMQMSMPTQVPANQNQQQVPRLLSQSQPQGRPYFPGHFQPSEPQAQVFIQAQSAQAQAQPQALTQLQGNTNINISSPSMSTPGTAGTVKRLHKPPSRLPGGSTGQGTASPMKTMELAPAVRRGKRKLPDNEIPEKVAALMPESALYTQLLEFESRVDAALARKKTDIVDSLKCPMRAQKVLRIYVFNTFSNQTERNPEKENVEPPSWSLKLIGRILEDGRDSCLEGVVQESSSKYPKFSSFFKKITIYLDQSLYPDNHVILWEGSRSPVLHEGFEVKRKGNKEFTAIIRLEMNYAPEKFKLSPALQEVLGIEVETRPRIMAALWHYVKLRKLQIPGDTSSFMCDPPLRKVFGEEKLKFSLVTQKITPHLTPPGPIHLEHRIKLSGSNPAGNACYDVLVDVPLSVEKELSTFLANLEKSKEIDACDEVISSAIKKINEHSRRRAFFLGFSQSPAEFINALIASQARDLKLAAADASRDVEKERHAEFYNQPWSEDAVIRYLNRKTAVGTEAAGYK